MTELIRALRCSNSTEHIDCIRDKCKYFYREPQEVIDKFREEHGGKFREFPDDIFETCDCEQIALDAADELERLCEDREKYGWHNLRKNPDDLPPNEEAVEIAFVNPYTGKYWTARAFYEDGTMHSEDSIFGGELYEWCEYDEDADDYIIPVGWFEHVMFGEFYTEINGKFVIAWREIEPFEPEEQI